MLEGSASAWNKKTSVDWIFDMFNLLVALHVLLAAKSLSANIAVVQGRCVAPLRDFSYFDFGILEDKKSYLVNEKVVRF